MTSLEEALRLQVVHQVVGVVRRDVAGGALALAEEDLLPAQLALARLGRVEHAEHVSFGAGGKSSSAWNSAMKCTWLPRSSTG
jgi:hypothetical protein